MVRRAGARGGLRVRQLHPRVHRPRGLLGPALQSRPAADRGRRHQVAGRGDDRAPHARPPVRRARRRGRAHLAAERRRQHGLLQHARARAAGVEEDLQDQRRDLGDGPRAAAERRPRRPLRLRPVADRPQVGPHPHRGPGLRGRAPEHGAQARGVGLAQLGGDRDRRRALLQAGAQPRHRRTARRALLLPDEVAPQPAPRRAGAARHRELHRDLLQAARDRSPRAPPRAAPKPAAAPQPPAAAAEPRRARARTR